MKACVELIDSGNIRVRSQTERDCDRYLFRLRGERELFIESLGDLTAGAD